MNASAIHRAFFSRASTAPHVAIATFAFVLWLTGPVSSPLLPWLCLSSALLATWHAYARAKLPSMFTWFVASYIGLFLIYPTLAPLFQIETPSSAETFADYCFYAVFGLHVFIIGYEVSNAATHRRQWHLPHHLILSRLPRVKLYLLLIHLAAVFFVAIDAGTYKTIIAATRDELMDSSSSFTMTGVYLLGLGSVLYTLVAVDIYHRRIQAITWIPILVALDVFLFLVFRVRTFAVMHIIGLLVGWFVIGPRVQPYITAARPPAVRMPMTSFQKGFVIIIISFLALSMFVLRVFRGQFETDSSDIQIDLSESVRYAFEGGGELGYTTVVLRIIELVPERYNYLYGQSYYRLFFAPIPRSLWPGKPLESQRIMAGWLDPDASIHQTTPVGIIGDLYVNFGPAGILGMMVFGCCFGLLDRGSNAIDAIFLSVSFPMIFHLARGSFTNVVIEMAVYYVISHRVADHLFPICRRNVRPARNPRGLAAQPA